jgi:hypothetical protein
MIISSQPKTTTENNIVYSIPYLNPDDFTWINKVVQCISKHLRYLDIEGNFIRVINNNLLHKAVWLINFGLTFTI